MGSSNFGQGVLASTLFRAENCMRQDHCQTEATAADRQVFVRTRLTIPNAGRGWSMLGDCLASQCPVVLNRDRRVVRELLVPVNRLSTGTVRDGWCCEVVVQSPSDIL